MNKKIIVCLFSFFSITLIGAEQEMKIQSAKRRETKELQSNRIKKVKTNHDEGAVDVAEEMEDTRDSFSFDDLKRTLEEVSSLSPEQLESHLKRYTEIEKINFQIRDAQNRVREMGKEEYTLLLLKGMVNVGDGKGLIALGRGLAAYGVEGKGLELERIGAEIEACKSRRDQTIAGIVSNACKDS